MRARTPKVAGRVPLLRTEQAGTTDAPESIAPEGATMRRSSTSLTSTDLARGTVVGGVHVAGQPGRAGGRLDAAHARRAGREREVVQGSGGVGGDGAGAVVERADRQPHVVVGGRGAAVEERAGGREDRTRVDA